MFVLEAGAIRIKNRVLSRLVYVSGSVTEFPQMLSRPLRLLARTCNFCKLVYSAMKKVNFEFNFFYVRSANGET